MDVTPGLPRDYITALHSMAHLRAAMLQPMAHLPLKRLHSALPRIPKRSMKQP